MINWKFLEKLTAATGNKRISCGCFLDAKSKIVADHLVRQKTELLDCLCIVLYNDNHHDIELGYWLQDHGS